MKKIILTVFAATSLLLYSTPSFAISLSVGVPVAATIPGDDGTAETDGTSGYFLGVQLPFGLGLGMDSHKTKFKDSSTLKVATSMYNIYYQLPVPVVNLIIGLGTGTTEYVGTHTNGNDFSVYFDKGSASQWYTSIGMPLIPLFDIHLSYRSITSKNVTYKGSGSKEDVSGTITGIGLAFNF